jgi:proline iminopeptidase
MSYKIDFAKAGWPNEHVQRYMSSHGAEGHMVDFRPPGGFDDTPCLLYKTKGAKTGKDHIVPLIYGEDGGSYVIVASKGGAPTNPGWYYNSKANPTVQFMVGSKTFTGTASVPEGAERERLLKKMTAIYPPYADYEKKAAPRTIPVVVLKPSQEIASL